MTLWFFLCLCFALAPSSSSCICTGPHTQWQPCFFDVPGVSCAGASSSSHSHSVAPLRTILLWQGFRDDLAFVYRDQALLRCSHRCRFTDDRSLLARADALLFSLIYLEPAHLPLAKASPAQAWIAHCGESPANFFGRNLRRPLMQRFDLHATISDSAHVRFNYLSFDLFGDRTLARLLAPPPDLASKTGVVVWLASNCNAPNGRQDYVAQLMQHMRVDNHGDCLRNMPADEHAGRRQPDWQQRKIDLIATYRFVLAFENSAADNYVTEKFYHALLARTVPIFMGTSDVHRFAPSNDSYIDVARFASARDLAEHLLALSNDRERYLALHAWRERPIARAFLQLAEESMNTVPCRVCEAVHSWRKDQATSAHSEL
jgi:hypothetical protein